MTGGGGSREIRWGKGPWMKQEEGKELKESGRYSRAATSYHLPDQAAVNHLHTVCWAMFTGSTHFRQLIGPLSFTANWASGQQQLVPTDKDSNSKE